MSHFVTVVILPKETPLSAALADPEAAVDPLLAPYDENLPAAPYETDCVCVGSVARHAASAATEAAHPIDPIRAHFWALPEAERTDARWQELTAPRQAFRDEALASHPLHGRPDPTCGFYTARFCDNDPRKIGQRFADGSGCGGTGRVTSTYPPHIWKWVNCGTGQEVARTRGDEVLPGLRAVSGSGQGFLPHAEFTSGAPLLVLQELPSRTESAADSGGAASDHDSLQIRPVNGGVRRAAGEAERSLRDLWDESGADDLGLAGGGSRPRDGQSARAVVRSMQLDDWERAGQPEIIAHRGDLLGRVLIGGPKWDWYEVGGRWHGEVCGPHDVCRVHEIAADASCFAIVTPDGAWHEKARMGWFGVSTDAKPAAGWAAIRRSIFAECGPHVAVSVDCHI